MTILKKSLLLIFFSLLLVTSSFAQTESQEEVQDSSFIVSGKIINPETLKGISFAHVKIHDSYLGIICDSLGFFRLRVNHGQKLKVTALGFQEQIVEITPPTEEDEVFQDILMVRQSYLLEEVDIYSLGSWKDFKENFVNTDVPVEENVASTFDFGNLNLAQKEASTLQRGGFGVNLMDGIDFIKKIRKKRRARNAKPSMADWQLRILQSKFNKKVVAELTHESGLTLEVLMEYINTYSNFTHNTSEMYIGVKVKQLHKRFLEERPQFEKNLTLLDSIGPINNHLRP